MGQGINDSLNEDVMVEVLPLRVSPGRHRRPGVGRPLGWLSNIGTELGSAHLITREKTTHATRWD